jgi:uracil-DNA glycosylase
MQDIITDSIEKHAPLTTPFQLNTAHPSWRPCLVRALETLAPDYRQNLLTDNQWLPGLSQLFNAFSLPLDDINYVLLGESPYPRAQSANGYAFWDAAVTQLWSPQGLSKPVNRATSLRNIMKMLLVAEGLLNPKHTGQADIVQADKNGLIQNNNELFSNFLNRGFLLLNASLVLQPNNVRKDARAWKPFLKTVLDHLLQQRPQVELILLGNIANEIDQLITQPGVKKFYAEHPYNLSFITNPTVLNFFRPLHLLRLK